VSVKVKVELWMIGVAMALVTFVRGSPPCTACVLGPT